MAVVVVVLPWAVCVVVTVTHSPLLHVICTWLPGGAVLLRVAASESATGSTGLHLPSLHATHSPLVHEIEEDSAPSVPVVVLLELLLLLPLLVLLLLLCWGTLSVPAAAGGEGAFMEGMPGMVMHMSPMHDVSLSVLRALSPSTEAGTVLLEAGRLMPVVADTASPAFSFSSLTIDGTADKVVQMLPMHAVSSGTFRKLNLSMAPRKLVVVWAVTHTKEPRAVAATRLRLAILRMLM